MANKGTIIGFRANMQTAGRFNKKCADNNVSKTEVLEALVNMYIDGKIEIKKTVSLDIEIK